jgi:hypothetical protein
MSLGLACAFGTYVIIAGYIPVIDSDAARYIVASLIAVISVLIALGVAFPMRKMVALHSASQNSGSQRTASQKRATPVATGYVVGGPVAANAVVMV